jgi:hypothetical protein
MSVTIQELQDKIKDQEAQYNELTERLTKSKEVVIADERALLACLQQLMPMQNTYLTTVINAMQKKMDENKK